MSTLLVDTNAGERLANQYDAVLRRSSPRDITLETRRFVSYLCDRLERNNHALMAAARNRKPDQIFTSSFACRQGENILLTCQFLLRDLAARVGRARIAQFLTETQTKAGRALARRISSRPANSLRIASVRFGSAEGGVPSRQFVAQPAPFAGTDAISASYRFNGTFPGTLRPALVLENQGIRIRHFVAAHIALFAQFAEGEPWQPTGGSAFAFLERISPMEAQVLALRGFDCMELIHRVDKQNRDPISLRLLARLV
jgi:hypothetical protein